MLPLLGFLCPLIVVLKGFLLVVGGKVGRSHFPYIFVLVLNSLSRLLDLVASNGVFNYHHSCKMVGLTHLLFADDLMVFTKANVDFILGVINVLDLFYSISGLSVNTEKIEIFAKELQMT